MAETAAVSWAAAELGGANLGDGRLNRRLVRVAERLGVYLYCPKKDFRRLREHSGHLVSQDGGGRAIL